MKLKNYSLAINSILIILCTTLIGTVFHECAHFLTGLFVGMHPELHHNYVRFPENDGTELQQTIVAAAGPVFSLVLGILFIFWSKRLKTPSLFKLFLLWFGMNGFLSFLGYFLIAPIASEGDTGRVFAYFNIPILISVIIAILSFIFIIRLLRNWAEEFRFYKNKTVFDQKENARQLFLYPIISSIVLVSLLSLPVTTWVSLLPTIFIPMAYFSVMGSYKNLVLKNAEFEVRRVSILLLISTILTAVIFRLLV